VIKFIPYRFLLYQLVLTVIVRFRFAIKRFIFINPISSLILICFASQIIPYIKYILRELYIVIVIRDLTLNQSQN